MAQMVVHKAQERGYANYGWLDTYHSFSFSRYFDPNKMNFGVLRVLNDDTIAGGRGFDTHPHDNMEIITIPLKGDLQHRDSMGNGTIIKNGDIQVMSAGSGITHSEFNPNADEITELLQIWVLPNKNNVPPRYDQMSLNPDDRHNTLQQVLSPHPDDAGVWIYQDVWFCMGRWDAGFMQEYTIKKEKNGVYVFVISGQLTVADQELSKRDALGIWDTKSISLRAATETEFLLMDVPMSVQR